MLKIQMTMTEEQIKEKIMDLTDNYHFNVGEMGFTAEKATELLEIDILNLIKQAQLEILEEVIFKMHLQSSYNAMIGVPRMMIEQLRQRNEERKGKTGFKQFIDRQLEENPGLREKLRKAEEELDNEEKQSQKEE